jgi:transposase
MTNTSLPLLPHPSTTTLINHRYALGAEKDLRVIYLHGQPIMEFHKLDTAGRDLIVVQLCEHGGLTEEEAARAFGVSRPTVSRAKSKYGQGGVKALIPERRGPKGPTKIKEYKKKLMISLAQKGTSKTEIASRLGVNESAVRKALRRLGLEELAVRQSKLVWEKPVEGAGGGQSETEVVLAQGRPEPAAAAEGECEKTTSAVSDVQYGSVAAMVEDEEAKGDAAAGVAKQAADEELPVTTSLDTDPQNRNLDRALAREGFLDDAAPLFDTHRKVQSAGLLLAMPILLAHGVFADAMKIFGSIGPAFYGIRNVVASLLLMFLARINRPEHLKEHSPQELGAVLGLDRAPEMKTLRRKIHRLSALNKSLEFMNQLMRRHLRRKEAAKLWLFVDGHVSVYSGRRKLKKQHVTRLRISMPSVLDYWVNDERGDPVIAVTGVAKKGLIKLLPGLIEDLRNQGEKRPLTVIFDREGWSPEAFARLDAMKGVFFLTYRKAGWNAQLPKLPAATFRSHKGEIDGQSAEYELADNGIYVGYGYGRHRKRLRLRQISRRRENGDQTHIVTNDRTSTTLILAHRMFSRWGQENFFKYMGDETDFDGLWTYAMEDADGDRAVANPERRKLASRINEVRDRLQDLTKEYGERALENQESCRPTMRGFKIANGALGQRIREVTEELNRLKQRYDSIPAMVPVQSTLKGEKLQQVRIETRRLITCFRIAAFRAESALRELLRPHYRRWRQDGRTIIQSMLQSSGDLEVHPGELKVILAPQSSPQRTRALAMLCEELNGLSTYFPGSNLRLNFSVQEHENVS